MELLSADCWFPTSFSAFSSQSVWRGELKIESGGLSLHSYTQIIQIMWLIIFGKWEKEEQWIQKPDEKYNYWGDEDEGDKNDNSQSVIFVHCPNLHPDVFLKVCIQLSTETFTGGYVVYVFCCWACISSRISKIMFRIWFITFTVFLKYLNRLSSSSALIEKSKIVLVQFGITEW